MTEKTIDEQLVSRITVIAEDSAVYVDGVAVLGVSNLTLPADFHALQWFGTYGEEERIGKDGRIVNTQITEQPAYLRNALEKRELRVAELRAIDNPEEAVTPL